VGHRGQVVGDEEIGEPELRLQVAQQVQDLGADGDVRRRDRLSEDHQAGRERERARDRDALSLASGELMRKELGPALGQAHQIDQPDRPPRDLAGPETLVGGERLRDDGVHPPTWVELRERILEGRLHRASILLRPPPSRSSRSRPSGRSEPPVG
jgi:hypothetical protein